LSQYNEWGQRIDKLETSEGWRDLIAVSQREGIAAIFYERKYGEHSRIYGFSKVLLMVADCQEVCIPPPTIAAYCSPIHISNLGFLSNEHDGWMCPRQVMPSITRLP
jgi:hypothetical protein